MSRERSSIDYLRDMLVHAQQAQAFVREMSFEQFQTDARTQAAVLWSLSVIGEAATHIPDELRSRYTSVPWTLIVGMRNRLIHAYPTTNVRIVWDTVQRALPDLLPQIEQILADLIQE